LDRVVLGLQLVTELGLEGNEEGRIE
jgi:hypothetical protein